MRKERWSTAAPSPTMTPHMFPHCSTGRVRAPHALQLTPYALQLGFLELEVGARFG